MVQNNVHTRWGPKGGKWYGREAGGLKTHFAGRGTCLYLWLPARSSDGSCVPLGVALLPVTTKEEARAPSKSDTPHLILGHDEPVELLSGLARGAISTAYTNSSHSFQRSPHVGDETRRRAHLQHDPLRPAPGLAPSRTAISSIRGLNFVIQV